MWKAVFWILAILIIYAALPPRIQRPIKWIGEQAGKNIQTTVETELEDPDLPLCNDLYSTRTYEAVEAVREDGQCR